MNSAVDVLIGVHGGTALSTSSGVTAVGGNVLNGGTLVTAEDTVAVGTNALSGASGDINSTTAVGKNDLFSLAGGALNTSVGSNGLVNLTTGSGNTQLGSQTIAIGGAPAMTGNNNLLLGYATGETLTSGSGNIIENAVTAAPVTSGNNNIIMGMNTAGSLNSGSNNIVLGFAAGQNMTNTNYDVLLGYAAGLSSQSDSLVAVGNSAGFNDTTGVRSTFVGNQAGLRVISGTDNTALGDNALSQLAGSESNNVGVGSAAQVAAGVSNAVQLGSGTNSLPGSLQFQSATVMDGGGRVHSSLQTPVTSTDPCVAGAIWADASYVYVCVATNSIERAALTAFGGTGAPSVSAGPFAATGATATITGTDNSGVVTVQIGSGTMAAGALATVSFSHPWPSAPNGCSLAPRNATTASDQSEFYSSAPTTTGWTISPVAGATLASGSVLQWSYLCN